MMTLRTACGLQSWTLPRMMQPMVSGSPLPIICSTLLPAGQLVPGRIDRSIHAQMAPRTVARLDYRTTLSIDFGMTGRERSGDVRELSPG